MKALFLDDDIARQQAFIAGNPGHEIACVTSAFEAMRLMRNGVFDVVLLDHDLDDRVPSGQESNGTGMHVVRWLVSLAEESRPSLMVVHSSNALGAGEMMRELTEAGRCCLYPNVA